MRRAFSLARAKAGNSIAARMAMIAMTTKSSIRVKPSCGDFVCGCLERGGQLFIILGVFTRLPFLKWFVVRYVEERGKDMCNSKCCKCVKCHMPDFPMNCNA